MKQFYHYFICLFLAFVSVACQEDKEVLENSIPVTFTVLEDSRSTQEGTFEDGDKIGVFAYDTRKKSFLRQNAKYVYDGSAFRAGSQSDLIFVTEGADIDFYVYSPYSESSNDFHNISFTVSSQSERSAWINADFMTADYKGVISQNHVIPLNFNHRMSTLEVKANGSESVKGLKIKDVLTSATFNLETGKMIRVSTPQNLDMYLYTSSPKTKYYRITIPAQKIDPVENDIIQSNMDGTSMNLRGSSSITTEEGKVVKFNVDSQREINVADYLPGGTTSGAGLYNLGQTCTLKSFPKKGYTFIDWFSHSLGTVSTLPTYEFTVKEDLAVTPRYRSYGEWVIASEIIGNPIAPNGGTAEILVSAQRRVKINGVDTSTETSDNVSLSMEPTPGFSLDGKKVTAQENTSLSDRKAIVIATIEGVEKELSISQTSGEQTYGTKFIELSATNVSLPATGGESIINAVAKEEIIINGTPTGKYRETSVLLSIKGGDSSFILKGNKVSVGDNKTTSLRSVVVEASTVGAAPKTITITQAKGVKEYTEWKYVTHSVGVTASNLVIGVDGGTSYLKLSANQTRTRNVVWNGVVTTQVETETGNYDRTSETAWSGGEPGFTRNGSTVTISANNTAVARQAKFIGRYDGHEDDVIINQNNVVVTYGDWEIKNAYAEPNSIGATGGSGVLHAIASRQIYHDGSPHSKDERNIVSGFSTNQSWCTIIGNSFKIDENTSTARRAEIIVSYEGAYSSFYISQSAVSIVEGPWNISVSTSSSTIPAAGGSLGVIATAERTITINGKQTTQTTRPVLRSSNSAFRIEGVTISAGNNKSTSRRSTTITASVDNSEKTLLVYQTAGSKGYSNWVSTTTNSLTVTGGSEIAAVGGETTMNAIANVTRSRYVIWNGVDDRIETDTETTQKDVTQSAEWNSSNSVFNVALGRVSVGNNMSISTRSSRITATYAGKSGTTQVLQKAGSKSYGNYSAWSTNSISAIASPSNVGEGAGSSTLKVSANQTRTFDIYWNGVKTGSSSETADNDVTSSVNWTGSATGFSRTGSSVTIYPNPEESVRSVTYTASYAGKTDQCTITQAAKTHVAVITYEFSASPVLVAIGSSGGSKSITVTSKKYSDGSLVNSSVGYSVSTPSWCSFSGGTLTVTENSDNDRSGKVILTQSGSGKTQTIEVKQKGKYNVDVH